MEDGSLHTSDRAVTVGVIGAGNFCRRQHLPNLYRMPVARIRAICDTDTEVLEGLASRYGPDYVSTNYTELLEDKTVEVVVIAVRDDLQPRITLDALDAAKHVYVEKPLSGVPEQIKPVLDASGRATGRLAVGFNKRFSPAYQRLKRLVDRYGPVHNVQLRMTDDAWRWARGYPPGFLLKLDVCHHFDLLRWLTGSEIATVYCTSSRPEDDALAVTMESGAVATIMFSGHGSMDMPKELVHVITDRGGISVEDFCELTTYGMSDEPHTSRFVGHSHPDEEFLHVHLLEQLGATGLRAIRRSTWELRQAVEQETVDQWPTREEVRRHVRQTIPNFMRNQGWFAALQSFLHAVSDGAQSDHADAADALAASYASEAAVQSRATGTAIDLSRGGARRDT